MSGCCVVRGTGECQFLGAKAESVGTTGFDEWDGLKRFRRGSEVGHVLGIAMAREQLPGDVGNDDDPRVDALDELSSGDFR